MRRSVAATVATPLTCLALALSVLIPSSATAEPPATGRRADAAAEQALATARAVLADTPSLARRTAPERRPDASLALRNLFSALPRLDAADRQEARRLLARPTDGADDPQQDGYSVPARRKCRGHFCIHWVTSTADAPPGQGWVDSNLKLMNRVWAAEVTDLGYRKPISDGARGGNGKVDVYLKDLGSRGIYGYCAPERRAAGAKWLASGYCVLDDDFSQAEFHAPPRDSRRVTAAHEFFHDVQFAYDYGEDPWMMEATATWMEERVADDIDDNRQYLPYGQVGMPAQPLDKFAPQGFNQYGNWAFFEYLSSRFGTRIVRSIWSAAGGYEGGGHRYSTAAVKAALADHGGFVKVFRAYAAGNTVPARTYAEGASWPSAPASRSWTLSSTAARADGAVRISHLASRNVSVRPGEGVGGKRWQLRVTVDGPDGRTDPAASVVVEGRSGVTTRAITLDGAGKGHTVVPFGSKKVRSVTVTLVNASTRFSCWHGTTWSCQGRARDNGQRFTVRAVASRG